MFRSCKGVVLKGYADSVYAGDINKRRSTTAYMFTVCDNCVSWMSQLQPVVALSWIEAEYMAATEAVKEPMWLEGFLQELKVLQQEVAVYSDSQSVLHLRKNPVFHEWSKHISVKYQFIRDVVSQGVIKLEKISTQYNLVDMGTKVLSVSKFNVCKNLLNIGVG